MIQESHHQYYHHHNYHHKSFIITLVIFVKNPPVNFVSALLDIDNDSLILYEKVILFLFNYVINSQGIYQHLIQLKTIPLVIMLQQHGWLMTVISTVGILGSWRLSLKISSIFPTSREHQRRHQMEFSRSRECSPYMPNANLVHVKKYWLPQWSQNTMHHFERSSCSCGEKFYNICYKHYIRPLQYSEMFQKRNCKMIPF